MAEAVAFAGAIAGGVEALAVQPLDMIKTRFQLNRRANPSVFAACKQLYSEGGIIRLYRGLLPEVAGNIPTRTAMYAGKDLASNFLVSQSGRKSVWTEFGAGWFAGLPEALVTTPFQVVKVRLQNKANNTMYRNSLDCMSKIVRREGVSVIFNGLLTTVNRNAVWNSVYFASMFVMQAQLGHGKDGHAAQLQNLGCGFVGGVTATCCNAPLDVAKSRIQGCMAADSRYTTAAQTLCSIVREEGLKSLYKGFVPKAMRMGLGGAVGITAFEFAKGLLQ